MLIVFIVVKCFDVKHCRLVHHGTTQMCYDIEFLCNHHINWELNKWWVIKHKINLT